LSEGVEAVGGPLLFLFLLGSVGACRGPDPPAGGERPLVVVSVLPEAWFVERLAGDAVAIEVMIPPGASHHTYEPTVAQMEALERARLYLSIGHPHFTFETAWLDRLSAASALEIVPVGADAPCREEDDPHVWVTPAAARVISRNVARALADLLPERRDAIESRLAATLEEIDAVDAEIRELLSRSGRSSFVVFHPAWGCFAADFGLEQLAIEHEGKEPTAGQLARVIERARAEGVRTVLVQPQLSRESAEVVAREIGAEVRVVDAVARDWPAMMRSLAQALAE
jgi:zinc transport system substrate-binding protein